MKLAVRSYLIAVQCVERGDTSKAAEALGWQGVGVLPDDRAETLFAFGCVATKIGEPGAQAWAKDLFSQAIRLFEGEGKTEQAQTAQVRLAVCYWREGATEEAEALLNSLSLVGVSSEVKAEAGITRSALDVHNEQWAHALEILNNTEPHIAEQSFALVGHFHNQRGIALKELGEIDKAVEDFNTASGLFEAAENRLYEGIVSNNLATLYLKRNDFLRANAHTDRSITIFSSRNDIPLLAQALDTKAGIHLAQSNLQDALRVANRAIEMLRGSDDKGWLPEILRTRARAYIQLNNPLQAKADLDTAAHECERQGNNISAGRLYLTMLEELDLGLAEFAAVYRQADEINAEPARLVKCARRLAEMIASPSSLKELRASVRLREEAEMIKAALLEAKGDIPKAALKLGLTRQGLAYKLKTHHPELLNMRKPPRKRSIVKH